MELKLKVATWYNNFQAPCVLMVDDLSDAYIDKYTCTHYNDWGYLCDIENSSYSAFKEYFLSKFPKVKITFFVPYDKHNVIKDDSQYKVKKFALGEREQYTNFLRLLIDDGHEIAHHGSNHGIYNNASDGDWIQEWETFDSVESGYRITKRGIDVFDEVLSYRITGGKYCGYASNQYSSAIIKECGFLYWCSKADFFKVNLGDVVEQGYIDFPTNVPGNIFVKYKYSTENRKKDLLKKVARFSHLFLDIFTRHKINRLVSSGSIISIQEHYSPSTTRGIVQSANIHSDKDSLIKIFTILSKYNIWYATCSDISKYSYVRENSHLKVYHNKLVVNFSNKNNLENTQLSIVQNKDLKFFNERTEEIFRSEFVGGSYVCNLRLVSGENVFHLINY